MTDFCMTQRTNSAFSRSRAITQRFALKRIGRRIRKAV